MPFAGHWRAMKAHRTIQGTDTPRPIEKDLLGEIVGITGFEGRTKDLRKDVGLGGCIYPEGML